MLQVGTAKVNPVCPLDYRPLDSPEFLALCPVVSLNVYVNFEPFSVTMPPKAVLHCISHKSGKYGNQAHYDYTNRP